MQDKFSFTQARLAKLGPPARGRITVRDTMVPGLALRITSKGAMTALVDKKLHGDHVRLRLGKWPGDFGTVAQLRTAARKVLADLEGAVQRRRRAREAPTLRDLFEHWIGHARLHKKTWRDDVRQFEKYLKPYHNRRLSSITKADVARWHSQIGEDHGPYQANRIRALVSAMYGLADELGYEGRNPCHGVKPFRERARDRFLQPAEMRPFFEALKEEPLVWRDFWLLCLFTGARRGNVAAMAWKDIDLEAGVWYLPGRQAKGGLPLAIVLPPPSVAILRQRRQDSEASPWVFPADTATGYIVAPRTSWVRVLKRSGIENLRPHDLRRSLGSWQAVAGASLPIIGASLGHRDPQATSVYARLQLDPVRKSVDAAVAAMLQAGGLLEAKKWLDVY